MKAIKIEDLYFSYQNKDEKILKGINLEINRGEVVAIVGLSGSGKSTLCNCISGIIPHIYSGKLSGKVELFGEKVEQMKISKIASEVGVIFQNPDTQLFSPIVEDELAFGPENLCIEREEIGKRIKESLRIVGMEEHRYTNPNQLSGGQKQLIAIASILTMKPKILICDEIMSQVDEKGTRLIKNALKTIKEQDKTIIMVEHNFNNLDIADRVMLIKDGKIGKFEGTL